MRKLDLQHINNMYNFILRIHVTGKIFENRTCCAGNFDQWFLQVVKQKMSIEL